MISQVLNDTMSVDCQAFLQQCLLFDIEVNENNSIYSIGAVFQGEHFQLKPGKKIESKQLQAFDEFGSSATYVLGHNILSHAKGEDTVVLTAGELLRLDVVDIDPDEHPDADSRVRSAVSWLERSGFLNATKITLSMACLVMVKGWQGRKGVCRLKQKGITGLPYVCIAIGNRC